MSKTYVCFNLNKDEREKSSSGGIFILLAKKVIEGNGVVFGARFDENWRVVHGYAENIEDVIPFLTSKYVQSSMGNMFRKAKEFLKNNRIVLFSGTPCQISGLKSYLGKEYSNLLTVDFICHGVPSPKVWEEYLKDKANGKTIRAINFRDKTEGWKKFSLKIEFEDGSIYRGTQFQDPYLKGFLKDIYLRPSCYQCLNKGIKRISDITLADFWGIEHVKPELFDDRGISAVLVHSVRGEITLRGVEGVIAKTENKIVSETENRKIEETINEAKNEIMIVEVATENIVQYNVNAVSSVKKPKERDCFFQKSDIRITKRINKYTKLKKTRKIKNFIRFMLKRH